MKRIRVARRVGLALPGLLLLALLVAVAVTTPARAASDGVATINGQSRAIDGTDVYRQTDFLVLYLPSATQTVSPANQWGAEVAVRGGVVSDVRDRTDGAPPMPIPADGFVLSGHGASRLWLLANATVGAAVTSPTRGTPTPTPTPTPTTTGSGCAGWSGQYWDNVTLTGTPALTRCDTAIDFSWPGTTSAGPGLSGTEDSARWTRTYDLTAGDWTFKATGDDGIRVKVDGNLVIDGWVDQGPTTYVAARTVAAGRHTVVVEHYERYGDATAKFSLVSGGATPPPRTGNALSGRWSVMASPMPLRALHGTLLRDGRILLIAGSGNDWEGQFLPGTFQSVVFDPNAGTFTTVPTPEDMFCAGHVTLPDGRVLVMGGTAGYAGTPQSATYQGLRSSYVFDPATNRYTRLNDAIDGHWYPTLTKLENGNVWAAGGYTGTGAGSTATEMFDSGAMQWMPRSAVPQTNRYLGTYPHMFLLADGRMFYTGGHTFGDPQPGTGSFVYNWRSATMADVPGLRTPVLRDQAGSVLLPPAQNQQFLIAGGGSTEYGGSTNTADLVDLNAASPVWRPAPDVPGPGRMYLNLTILPDRSVLASNGATATRSNDVLAASIYSPGPGTWQTVAADPVGRDYHSVALLLPDGRVVVFGSNPADNSFEKRISVYEPPYLFWGARPVITSAPAAVTYGQSFALGVTGSVVSASLVSPGSATHQTDTNSRLVDLPLSGGTTKTASVPANRALLPPGPYMLTVVDDLGIPSVAKWVNVR